ncbi:hypothetical protein Droror1_Dr00016179 [Drosera rotundifolia]
MRTPQHTSFSLPPPPRHLLSVAATDLNAADELHAAAVAAVDLDLAPSPRHLLFAVAADIDAADELDAAAIANLDLTPSPRHLLSAAATANLDAAAPSLHFDLDLDRDYSTSGLTALLLRPKQLRQQHSPATVALQRCSSSSGAAVRLSDDVATAQDWWCSPKNTRDFDKNSVSGDGFRQQDNFKDSGSEAQIQVMAIVLIESPADLGLN